jgi:hypothetical protein
MHCLLRTARVGTQRPVSLISRVYKTMELVLYTLWIFWIIGGRTLQSNDKCGFRSHRSYLHHLVKALVSELVQAYDTICQCCILRSFRWYNIDSGYHCSRSLGSVVNIATAYGLDGGGFGVRVPVGSRIFSSPTRPDRLCGPPNLLSNGYRGLFPRE